MGVRRTPEGVGMQGVLRSMEVRVGVRGGEDAALEPGAVVVEEAAAAVAAFRIAFRVTRASSLGKFERILAMAASLKCPGERVGRAGIKCVV